eukprot:2968579-Rhodomonas_salina.1
MRLDSISPSSAQDIGGTAVTVRGFGLDTESDLACQFGMGGELTKMVHSSDGFVCVTPAAKAGNVSLAIIRLTDRFPLASISFRFLGTTRIVAAQPSRGFVTGGTLVRLQIRNTPYPQSVTCMFGTTPANGRYERPDEVSCISPVADPGVEQVTMGLRAGTEQYTSDLTFTFLLLPWLKTLQPSFASTVGGTPVILFGTGLGSEPPLACKFGDLLSASQEVISSSALMCVSPASPTDHTVAVFVSANLQDWTRASLPFSYVPTMEITRISPAEAGEGSTVLISVFGKGFIESNEIWCDFDGTEPRYTPTTHRSSGLLTCSNPGSLPPGKYSFSLVDENRNKLVASGPVLQFQVLSRRYVKAVLPSRGPVRGNAITTVIGTAMTGTDIHCMFDRDTSAATIVSSTVLSCLSTKHKPGPVSFQVEFHGEIDETAPVFEYEYVVAPKLEGIQPSLGSTDGTTFVTVSGQHFLHDDTFCKFGSLDEWVHPIQTTDSSVLCTAPAHPAAQISVSIVSGGAVSSQSLAFEYIQPPLLESVFPIFASSG